MPSTSVWRAGRLAPCSTLAAALMAAAAVGAQPAPGAGDQGGTEPAAPSASQAPSTAPATQDGARPDFSALDANGNQIIDEQEAQANPNLQRDFERLDSNSDGQISPSEFATFGAVERGGDASAQEVQRIREEAKSDPQEGAAPGESWFTAPEDKPAAGAGENR